MFATGTRGGDKTVASWPALAAILLSSVIELTTHLRPKPTFANADRFCQNVAFRKDSGQSCLEYHTGKVKQICVTLTTYFSMGLTVNILWNSELVHLCILS